ncbi:unnamed protein product [Triticum turgidum subsp. durum]|uniref:Uncharacterized protein n=3 Tax=Triticum TaxID=4564 RepID=A0A9R0T748_TRITD|nr:unnamed protein product [Triticum turgidum subsp. durum]
MLPGTGPLRAGLAHPFPRSFRPFICIPFPSAGARDGIMAAACSLSPLPLAPPVAPRPALFSRCVAAPRRGRNAGGGTGRLRLARRLRPPAAAIEEVEQTEAMMRVAADDDSITATVVSVLLTVSFVGLSLLTIGVIYLAVQDFLQKRESEKFEREEAERQKEEARQKRAKARGKKRNRR